MKKLVLFIIFIAGITLDTRAQDSTLQQYVGKYKFEGAEMEATIALDKEVLTITFPAGTFVLKRTALDTFQVVDRDSLVEFRRGSDKKITMLLIYYNNLILEGIKQNE